MKVQNLLQEAAKSKASFFADYAQIEHERDVAENQQYNNYTNAERKNLAKKANGIMSLAVSTYGKEFGHDVRTHEEVTHEAHYRGTIEPKESVAIRDAAGVDHLEYEKLSEYRIHPSSYGETPKLQVSTKAIYSKASLALRDLCSVLDTIRSASSNARQIKEAQAKLDKLVLAAKKALDAI